MKKLLFVLLTLISSIIVWTNVFYVSAAESVVLRVYNWQDYIDDGLDDNGDQISTPVIDLWIADYKKRTGVSVEVVYDTFETPETMLNTLKTGKSQYDLACPSDYTIQKMIKEGMLEKFDTSKLTYYNQYASPYLKDLFDKNGWTEYAVPYMWGTVGLLYNPEAIDEKDVSTWNVMWDSKYQNMATTKDSVRDTYFVGVMHVYQEELHTLRSAYLNGEISQEDYNKQVNVIMNRTDDDTLAKVETDLKLLKENLFGLEVDSGKSDIVSGKISMNLAWSGDAVYSMDLAEEEDDKLLAYAVPEEGSNVWYDGWVMPKGANIALATDFVDFLSRPEIAVLNMNKIGYTSAIAGQEVLDMIVDWYGAESEESAVEMDLTYFFGNTVDQDENGKVLVSIDEHYIGRQFSAQYPDYETIIRCGVMEDFGDKNDAVLEMWANFKANELTPLTWASVIVLALITAVVMIRSAIKQRNRRLHIRH
ncbi:MAG: ABC transporter substrate-binding protein [Bacilli bacterium]|nr:ABC transporter substrate-binding protein [Bacilli bacterium]